MKDEYAYLREIIETIFGNTCFYVSAILNDYEYVELVTELERIQEQIGLTPELEMALDDLYVDGLEDYYLTDNVLRGIRYQISDNRLKLIADTLNRYTNEWRPIFLKTIVKRASELFKYATYDDVLVELLYPIMEGVDQYMRADYIRRRIAEMLRIIAELEREQRFNAYGQISRMIGSHPNYTHDIVREIHKYYGGGGQDTDF